MTDPKVFTGPGGYEFQIEGRNVLIGLLSAPHPASLIVPLADLAAFLAELETQEAFAAALPPKPIDFRAGTFTTHLTYRPWPENPDGFVVQREPRRLRPSCTCGKDRDCTAPVCQCGDTSCECPLARFNQHPVSRRFDPFADCTCSARGMPHGDGHALSCAWYSLP